MRTNIKIKILTFLTMCLGYSKSWSQNATLKQPNVLFIICDDLNDYQGVFGGHPQAITPNIDKLAASGVRFINAQSNVPVCSPSRNSLITGVYPHASKDYGWTNLKKQPVLKNNKTLIRYFKENGYYTLGTGKIIHGNVNDDFDEWGNKPKHNYGPFYYNGKKTSVNPSVPSPYRSIGPIDGSYGRLSEGGISEGKRGEIGWIYGWDNKPLRYVNDNDRDLLQDELHAQWAVNKLKELEMQDTHKPFFMGIGFVRPHTPMHAPDKYFDMFPIKDLKLDKWKVEDTNDTYWKDNFSNNLKGPKYYKMLLESYNGDREVALKHVLQAYLACVAFVDEQVGKVIEGLNNSTFKNNTIVVFTSDHGWQMGEKEYFFKNSPWEESARIPLIIKTPTPKAGLKVEQPVSLIDLYPTLKDLCNLKGDHKINKNGGDLGGYSLRSLLEKSKEWEGPTGALTIVGNYGTKYSTKNQNFSYRTKDWRYIVYSNGKEELYNHKEDPYEWENVADKKKNKKIKKRLHLDMNKIIKNR